MSRIWLALILVITLGAIVGLLMFRDPGYLLVSYAGIAFETSIWMALILLVASYLLVRLLVWVVRGARSGFASVADWNMRRRVNKSHQMTSKGLLLWAEGDWRESERLLSASAADSENPLINYLFAARCAQASGNAESRDRYLDLAIATEPGASFAVNLQRAEFLLASGVYADAAKILKSLRAQAPRHPKVLLDLADCCEQTGERALQLELLNTPGLTALLPEAELAGRIKAVWMQRVVTESVDTVWSALPKALRKDAALLRLVVERLVVDQKSDQAEEMIRGALKQDWSASLVEQYGRLVTTDVSTQIRHAEDWLKKHPGDPDLLLALGRMYLRNQMLDQAENSLRACLRVRSDNTVHAELGKLLVTRGELSRGVDHLLQALPAG